MADTGSPWFIPYVEPGDLVRDYPAASLALGTAIAGGLSSAANPGIGSNVVQAIKTDTLSSSSTSFVDVSDLSVTITPSSNTSRILVLAQVVGSSVNATGGSGAYLRLLRDSTHIGVAASPGSRTAVNGLITFEGYPSSFGLLTAFIHHLDAPTTDSAVTYKIQARTSASTFHINRSSSDTDNAIFPRAVSTIIAIEVAP